MLMGNFYLSYNFAFGLLLLFLEEQLQVYSDRRNRPQIRYQIHIPLSLCSFHHIKPSHFQLYILQLVLDLGKVGRDTAREMTFYVITFFYGMNYGVKASLASLRS